ncbi:MAG TPA: hypothetical protein P5121_33620 [Caldilineaceae bacterium]|nr:hypothetical protein [Caldilineaceae bacterium]
MQAKPKILKIFVVALILSLMLAACGGDTTGSTWFNLPSIPVKVQENGNVTVFGLAVMNNPALLEQLRTASVQKLEVRIGYNGIHIYANGNDLPYISWDAESVDTLQDLLRRAPALAPGTAVSNDLIANSLPILRQIGLGVSVIDASADTSALTRWRGETTATPEEAESVIGPFQLGGIAFDESGNLSIGGLSASALGMNGPLLDANTLGMLQSYGIENLQIQTEPNGINLSMNGRPLPSITYDSAALANVVPVVQGFAPELAPTLESALPMLQNAALDVAVSFTGEPVGELALSDLPVALNEDGTVSVFGVSAGSTPLVPADLMAQLQATGVQQLNVEIGQDGLFLAADGQTLPTITWTPENLAMLSNIIAPLAGIDPAMIASGMAMIEQTGAIKAAIALPGATPTTSEINKTIATPDTAGVPVATIHADAVYSDGAIQSVGGLPEGVVPGLPLALPPNVAGILGGLDADQVELATDAGKLNLLLDGETALTVNYDQPSLTAALDLAGPFLAGTPLENPAVRTLVQEQILPLVPAADLDVTVALQ